MKTDFLSVLDVIGVFVFALSGSLVAIRRRMDIVGVLTLALVTGFGGGVARDLLIADLPPQVIRSEGLLLVPVAAGVTAMVVPRLLHWLRQPVLALDAVGLGLFAAVGASTALDAGLGTAPTVLVGTVSAVGGGLIRDLLADEVPQILVAESHLYAIPAALGALIVALGSRFEISAEAAQAVAVAVTVVLRLLALSFGWHAPTPRRAADGTG
jgi:uncharacterized membrane protein YeiH